jgi:type IV pilus assembly protein PilB
MSSTETVNRDTAAIALPGLGRALVAAGKLGQKSAEDVYKKALSGKNSFIGELVGAHVVADLCCAFD